MSYENFEPWSYEVLCSDDAMKTFYELCSSKDLAHDIERKLDKILLGKKARSGFDDCINGMTAAALVAYSECENINCYNLLDLDLDKPDDKEKFYKEYDPFLDVVFHTDLSHLNNKAIKVLDMLHNTELGGWWYEEDMSLEWITNIAEMSRELKKRGISEKLKHKRESKGIRSYQVLCSNDAMKIFHKLSDSSDLAGDIEKMLNNVNRTSDYRTSTEGLVAAALVAYAECDNINCYNLLDLDLDIPEDKAIFYNEYDPFLDKVYHTDLSRLKKKARSALKMIPDTKLGELWRGYDDDFSDWIENIDEMINELK